MTGTLVQTIGALSRGLDGLLPAITEPVGDAELVDAQRELQAVARKVYAAQLELDAATEHAGLAPQHGYPTLRGMLAELLRLHPRDAAAREAHRVQLAHRRSLTGELLPPRLPETARALREGAIGAAHAEVVDKVLQQLPDTLDLPTRTMVEEQIAGFARNYSPRETGILAAQVIEPLRGLTDRMRTLARQWGGQGDAMSAIAHRSTRLLSGPGTDSTKQALGSALAELHTEAGWCCFDSGLYDHAEQHFRRALEIAGEAGDSYQMAYTLRHIGIYLSETGGPNEGLKALQLGDYKLADARSDRAPALGAWLHAESAVALTRMNRPELARTELARARDGWEPPEAFDQADMDYAAAWVMAQLGDLDAAEALLDSSLGTWAGSSDRRDAVKAEITRATLHVRAGERNGLPMAEQVIRNVTELRGTRARARLAPLIDALAGRPDRDSRELAGHVHRVSVERV